MKKILSMIFCMTLVFVLISCSNVADDATTNSKPNETVSTEYVETETSMVEDVVYVDEHGMSVSCYAISYKDKEGNTLKYELYNDNDEVIEYREYQYDTKGNLQKFQVYNGGKLSFYTEYNEYGDPIIQKQYDKDGAVIETDEYKYEYDKNGNILLEEVNSDGKISSRTEYHVNGVQKSVSLYVDGMISSCRKYDEENKLLSDSQYENGVILTSSTYEYYGNGNMKSSVFYEADKLSGSKEYYENGEVKSWSFYKEGELTQLDEFYENGNKKARTIYKNGEIVRLVQYDENGNEIKS